MECYRDRERERKKRVYVFMRLCERQRDRERERVVDKNIIIFSSWSLEGHVDVVAIDFWFIC